MTTATTITVTVRPFSGIQHMLGGEKKLGFTLPAGSTVASLRGQLVEQYPVLQPFMNAYVIAVAEEIQDTGRVLQDGDVVDLIPPIAGG
jgi:molybdopterin converting factor small subunit